MLVRFFILFSTRKPYCFVCVYERARLCVFVFFVVFLFWGTDCFGGSRRSEVETGSREL